MPPQPGYRKGYVSGPVKAFCTEYFAKHGRVPNLNTIIAAHPEFEDVKDTVKKARARWKRGFQTSAASVEAQKEPTAARVFPKAPKSDKRPWIEQRLNETEHMIEVLKGRAENGDVDAHQFDKLTRLQRQLKQWQKDDAEEARNQQKDEAHLPILVNIFQRADERKRQGLTKGGPRPASEGRNAG